MATAVFFHAHPDDEALSTGGTMLLASDAGHRVVLVCATDGSRGETPGLDDGQELEAEGLAEMREAELHTAAGLLGVHRVVMLGYRDSGMAGDPANEDPECFWQADDGEAAERLAEVLSEEQADLLTCYDANGIYGHPDHIKVHRVGVRAAELAGVDLVYEATLNREHFRSTMKELMRMAAEAGLDTIRERDQAEFEAELDDGTIGVDSARITHHIDVSAALDAKRAAIRAHVSQIPADSFFVALPDEAFALVLGTEWFIRRGAAGGDATSTDLFAALDPE
ncbi:MAG: GlcNAc-PI de-N-acetylase [Acidimicrobiaceae bacterium]|nr:GlcNAc-PI de-N-acetylase [Acidimicrobiaceae bacterium]MYK74020.1 GlcNAc-PI de-N-acetylase [Acidimicrobiaceae bacterium]